jgi:hypothetical protein
MANEAPTDPVLVAAVARVAKEAFEREGQGDADECRPREAIGSHLALDEPSNQVVLRRGSQIDEGLPVLHPRGLHQERTPAFEEWLDGREAWIDEGAIEETGNAGLLCARARVVGRQQTRGDRGKHRHESLTVGRRGGARASHRTGGGRRRRTRVFPTTRGCTGDGRRHRRAGQKDAPAVEGSGGPSRPARASRRSRPGTTGRLPLVRCIGSPCGRAAVRLVRVSRRGAQRTMSRRAGLVHVGPAGRGNAARVVGHDDGRVETRGGSPHPVDGATGSVPLSPIPAACDNIPMTAVGSVDSTEHDPTWLPPRLPLGLGFLAGAVFLVEVAALRAIAQVTWPPFSFVALAAAMLGGGFASVLLAVARLRAAPALPGTGALLVVAGAPLAMLATLRAGLEPLRAVHDAVAAATLLAVLLLWATPFVGLALALSSSLARAPRHGFVLYGADLVGAAAGAFCAPVVVDSVGTAGTSLVASAVAALAGVCFLPGRMWLATGLMSSGLAIAALPTAQAIVPRPTVDKQVGDAPAALVLERLAREGRLASFDGIEGRVDVLPARPQAVALLDLGAAVTRAPGPHAAIDLPRDTASAAFLARSAAGGRVLVVGSGAGWEVDRALRHGAEHVDAVEISGPLLAATATPALPTSRALYANPRVAVHHDEARAFLARDPVVREGGRHWRHIVAVHTITNAAFTTHALRLVEDFLLTREALHAMLAHVDDDGVLFLTRPANQLPLLADLARGAVVAEDLAANDADVDRFLAVLEPEDDDPFFRGLLVARRPLERDWLPAPAGHRWSSPPVRTGAALPDDDRPFFHRIADDVDVTEQARLRIEGRHLADRAVLAVGVLATATALLGVLLPFAIRRRRERRAVGMRGVWVLCAVLLGLSFLFVELSLAQRLTLTVGRPAVAFAVVVGGLLLGAGGTGLVAARRRRRLGLAAALAAALAGVGTSLVAATVLSSPDVLALPAGTRMALVVVACTAVGGPLGLCFPALLEAAGAGDPHTTAAAVPWLSAVNSIAGVAASALHAAAAPLIGLQGTTLVALAGYGLALLLAISVRAPTPPRAHHA